MPNKRNPVAAVVILGCTRRAPGLLATLAACAEQEHQRAAGAWHAEWEPIADLLRLTASAASWAAELLAGLEVDADRMRANLDAAGGLPLAESVAAALAPALGRLPAHDLVAEAAVAAAASGGDLRGALLEAPDRGPAEGRRDHRGADRRGGRPGRVPGVRRGVHRRGARRPPVTTPVTATLLDRSDVTAQIGRKVPDISDRT
jgi:adenylosuccinate lyase